MPWLPPTLPVLFAYAMLAIAPALRDAYADYYYFRHYTYFHYYAISYAEPPISRQRLTPPPFCVLLLRFCFRHFRSLAF
jgi:hypothetical protein